MGVPSASKPSVARVFWRLLELLSRKINRLARKHSQREIVFSHDPRLPFMGRLAVMNMLDAMPSWSFDPRREALTTRAAAASSEEHTPVSPAELQELIVAIDSLAPGRSDPRVVGLSRAQYGQVKAHVAKGSGLTSMQTGWELEDTSSPS